MYQDMGIRHFYIETDACTIIHNILKRISIAIDQIIFHKPMLTRRHSKRTKNIPCDHAFNITIHINHKYVSTWVIIT